MKKNLKIIIPISSIIIAIILIIVLFAKNSKLQLLNNKTNAHETLGQKSEYDEIIKDNQKAEYKKNQYIELLEEENRLKEEINKFQEEIRKADEELQNLAKQAKEKN